MRRSTYSCLVSYPPEKIYPIKKPGDVPKMTPGDHSTYRYCTYSSGGDTVLEQLLVCHSTSMLKAPCAERWTSAPVRTCLHATASSTVPTAPTLRRLSFLWAIRVQRQLHTVRTLVDIKDHTVAILKPVLLLLCFARNHPAKPTQPKSHKYPPGSLATSRAGGDI